MNDRPVMAMTVPEAREWLEELPFRDVDLSRRYDEHGLNEDGEPCDPHAYVILEWREVDRREFWRFVALIRAEGYRGKYTAPYAPDYVMTNTYLKIDEWIYWFIGPNMLNRQHERYTQHVRI